jgi:hypothetical protein
MWRDTIGKFKEGELNKWLNEGWVKGRLKSKNLGNNQFTLT